MQEVQTKKARRRPPYQGSTGTFQAGAALCTRRALLAAIAAGMFVAAAGRRTAAADGPVRIVALGDSLTAGLGLPAASAFPVKLQAALRAKGHAVEIANAGVSGDTASGGLARLDWSIPDGTEAVIVELGANDALRGIPPDITWQALDAILARLNERRFATLLCGMRAPPNLGAQYSVEFERIFPILAEKYGTLLYPFFLEGVAARQDLNQPDGLHPTAAGVDAIVAGILPLAEELVARALKARRG